MPEKLYITEIHHEFDGDTFFPDWQALGFNEITTESHQPDEKKVSTCPAA